MSLEILVKSINRMKGKVAITILIACSSLASGAQDSRVGNWFIYFGNQKISKQWNWWNELQHRNYNFAGDLQQLLLRTGLGYHLSDKNNLLVGYAYIKSQRYVPDKPDKLTSHEHRIYQQFIHKDSKGIFILQNRIRCEERFLPDDFQMRFRYFLSANIPVNHKQMVENTLYFSVYNEIFLNAQGPLFDRNRLFGAAGFVFNKYLKIEIGFMAQTLETSSRNQFQVVVFNNIPFSSGN